MQIRGSLRIWPSICVFEVDAEEVGRAVLAGVDAFILDLDGVVTQTAQLHSLAWKRLFDEYSERRKARSDAGFSPFDARGDYLRYVDGRPRTDGVRGFLEARGIRLPLGGPEDSEDLETIHGLGNRKNRFFQMELEKSGPKVFPDAVEALRKWRAMGFRTAVASSSKNCEKILRAAGLSGFFDVRVDGTHLEKWKLRGKPAPDLFLAAARLLGVWPAQAAVLEDAIAGIEAARAGKFGLVIGVERFGQPARLKEAGADLVVSKLTDIPVPEHPRRAA